jgi:hypothetical protein
MSAAHRTAVILEGVDLEGLQIRDEEHVRFLDAGEALDGAAVEHDLAVQGLLELTLGDFDVLDDAVDIGELEAQEVNGFLGGGGENVLGRFRHRVTPFGFVSAKIHPQMAKSSRKTSEMKLIY